MARPVPPPVPWYTTGNSITNPANEFLGTTNPQALVVKTANTEHVRIDASGHVGIGTATPSTALHVSGDLTVTPAAGAQGEIVLGAPASVISSQVVPPPSPPGRPTGIISDGSALVFSTSPQVPEFGTGRAPVEHLRIDPEGNVGVGTSTPVATLDVRGQGAFQGPLAINNRAAGVGLGEPPSDDRAAITFGATDSPSAFYIGAITSNTRDNTTLGVYSYAARKWVQGWAVSAPAGPHPSVAAQFAGDVTVGVGPDGSIDANATLQVAGDIAARDITAHRNVNVDGDVILTGADCAEEFQVTGAQLPDPGTVMVIDDGGGVSESRGPYDKKVAGVVSGAGNYKHGLVLDKRPSDEPRVAMALVGKVYCKVDARYSPVEVGDLLTTSPTPGHAMKAADPLRAFGSVIGKALRALESGHGLIPILVALQ